jgi:hypothetical protein
VDFPTDVFLDILFVYQKKGREEYSTLGDGMLDCSFFADVPPAPDLGLFYLLRKWLIQLYVFPQTPFIINLNLRPPFQTLSNAFSISRQTVAMCFCLLEGIFDFLCNVGDLVLCGQMLPETCLLW